MSDKIMFFVINEEGIREDAQLLAKYKASNMKDYITYTYGEINDSNMIKIYTTGVDIDNGNYTYREILTNNEWDEIKDIMKNIAKDPSEPFPTEYISNLNIEGEEVSIRKPKKLLVSKKFADTLASKIVKNNETMSIPDLKIENAINTPADLLLDQESEKEDILNKTIEIPTFEELQARNKNIETVIGNTKVEPIVENPIPVEEFKIPSIEKEDISDEIPSMVSKSDYKEQFKKEVEPVLMDVYTRQMEQIEKLEEELSKTKFDLFEKQKETLSLKKENDELHDKSNSLKEELNDVQTKMNGILDVIQGNNNN